MPERRLELFQAPRGEGCSEATALEAVGWSRATLHRWRKRYRADFEQACEDLKIPLFAPPKRPQPDGCVERANDTTRVEFWNRYDGDFTVKAANRALDDYRRFHHQVRPHQALDFMTPDEYLRKNKDSPSQSHMC